MPSARRQLSPRCRGFYGSVQQYPDMNCDALNTERTRLLAVRADLETPLRSNTDAQREAELIAGEREALRDGQSSVVQELPSLRDRAAIFGCAVAWCLTACSNSLLAGTIGAIR